MTIMKFKKALDVKAIDIVDAWTANNTDTGVSIILNNRGKYELWMAETLIEEFKEGDRVIVEIRKSSDRELQQLSKKFGDTVSGVVIGQTGKILMVKTDKGQINPFVKDVVKEEMGAEKTLHGIFDTFDAAVREAECIFDVTVSASGN